MDSLSGTVSGLDEYVQMFVLYDLAADSRSVTISAGTSARVPLKDNNPLDNIANPFYPNVQDEY